MTDDEALIAALQRLAKRTGFSISEIFEMAKGFAEAEIDPLPADELGPPFKFARRKLCLFDDDDFLFINPVVPEPNACVDLLEAREEFASDMWVNNTIYAEPGELTFEQMSLLFLNSWRWCRFLAVRHPYPEQRAIYERLALACGATAERLEARLRAVRVREAAEAEGPNIIHLARHRSRWMR
jgi:hypothetical protein